jgi:organic radical activating enzyme
MRLDELLTPPKTLALAVTFQCTAACKNCCFGCSPKIQRRLTLSEMKSYVDQAVENYGFSLKVFVLTGGECFLLKKDLPDIIEYGSSKGLIVRVVTNGYWAETYKKAYETLTILKKHGLQEINFSTGDDHQHWVPYDNIVNGCSASMDLGLTCAVNIEYHDGALFSLKTLMNDKRLLDYFDGLKYNKPLIADQSVWIPFDKDTSVTYETANLKEDCMRCTSLFSTMPINPYSYLMSCCGLTSEYIKPLRLGLLNGNNMKELYESQFSDFLKIWLYVEGPKSVLEHIYKKRHINRKITGHICYICAEIYKDNDNILWVNENYKELMPTIMLKYIMLKQSFN